MKLISMTDFVLEQSELKTKNTEFELGLLKSVQLIYNYANFIKQPLTLGMFVPCDLDGNVLEEIDEVDGSITYNCDELDFLNTKICEYQQAKDRVIFDGFSFSNNILYNSFQTIEFMNFSNGNVTINLVD